MTRADKTHVSLLNPELNKEALGFIGNRLQMAVLREEFHIIQEGITDAATVDDVMKYSLGRRWNLVGPIASMDLGGLDVFYNISTYLFDGMDNDTGPSPLLAEKIKAGERDKYGRKISKVPAIAWYTNLDIDKRHESLILCRRYADDPSRYPHYDNYDAIEVSRVKDIPEDYYGVMGVPITFMDSYNPEQFEIIGCSESEGRGFSNGLWNPESGIAQPTIGGRKVYKRLFIRRRA